MQQTITIGTHVPGRYAPDALPALAKLGFERLSLGFHMTLGDTNLDTLADGIRRALDGTGVSISSLGFYCNPLQNEDSLHTLEACIDKAHLFGTSMVSTFGGALNGEPVEAAIPAFKKVYGELARRAADQGVTIALENCAMGSTWKRAQDNIAYCPRAWELLFDAVPADNLGLEWEPAHAMAFLIDPVAELKKWVGKVKHVHGKDAHIDWDVIRTYGFGCGVPSDWNRTPGFGDTDWRQIFTVLYQAGYVGDISIEGYHDPIYKGEREMTGQLHALNYLKWARGGDYAPNPWDARA